MKLKPLILAIIALAALAACKSGGANPTTAAPAKPANANAPAASLDACTLLTTEEATAVLGSPVKKGAPHSYQQTVQCQWDAVKGPADGSVAILVWIGGQKDQWSSTESAAKASKKFSEVSGLGDAAFSNGFDLHILKGDNMYQIGVAGPFTNNVDRATDVAKKALARA
jgi:glucose/arabinose dehydrogenase